MKFVKVVLTTLLLNVAAAAQVVTYTPNLNLAQPPQGYANYAYLMNNNLSLLDSAYFFFKGAWSSTVTYQKGSMVTYGGSLYVSNVNGNLNHVPNVSSQWTFVITGAAGAGTVTSFAAPSGSWPSWLVPTVTNPTSTPSLAVAAGPIPFSALASLSADQVLGATALGSPNGLSLPACTGSSNALQYTLGVGFSCGTISGGGGSGVQYNPTTTKYWFMGSSILADDGRNTSSAVPAGAWSCNGTTCSVHTTSAHNLTTSSYVDLSALTGWFGPNPHGGLQDTGYGSFPVASVTGPNDFTVAYTLNTGSGTGGSVYDASYWGIYTAATQPFLNGHGTSIYRWAPLSVQASFFTSNVNCASGSPSFLIIQAGQNDIFSGVSSGTIEGYLLSIYSQAHANGCKVNQQTILPTNYGLSVTPQMWQTTQEVNQWIRYQGCNTAALKASGQCWDFLTDVAPYSVDGLNDKSLLLGNGSAGTLNWAEQVNDAMGHQGGKLSVAPMFMPWETGVAFNVQNWFFLTNTNGPFADVMTFDQVHNEFRYYQNYGSGGTSKPLFEYNWGNIVASNVVCNAWNMFDGSGNNHVGLCVGYAGNGNAKNFFGISGNGDSITAKYFADGTIQWPHLAAASGTELVCVDTSGNVLHGGSCPTGSGTGFNAGLGASYQDATEIAAPANPSAGNDRMWVDSTSHQLNCKTSSGANCMPTSSSPLTTKGDLYGHSTVDARIPVGSDGQVLTADSTQPLGVKWAAGGGGGGSSAYPNWYFDDMVNVCCVGTSNANSGSGAGVGTAAASATFGTGVNGIATVFTSATNNTWATLDYGTNNNPVYLSNIAGSFSFAAKVWSSGVTTAQNHVAFVSGTTGPNPAAEFGFECNSAFGNSNWWTEVTGTAATDTGVSCVGAWHQLEINVVNGAITYYVDNVSVATGTVTNTNSVWFPGFITWSNASSAATTLNIDWAAYTNTSGITFQPPSSGGSAGAWSNITSTLSITGCGTNTGGVCTISGGTTTTLSGSIPGGHQSIMFKFYGGCDTGTDQASGCYLDITFNSLGGSNYSINEVLQIGVSNPVQNSGNPVGLCTMGQLVTGGRGGIATLEIPEYADTNFQKAGISNNVFGGVGGQTTLKTDGCTFLPTAAITSFSMGPFITTTPHNFAAGSKLMILVQD